MFQKLIPALILTIVTLTTACAFNQKNPKYSAANARCTEVPQWHTTDVDGNIVGMYVCFSPDNNLLYKAEVITQEPPQPEPNPKLEDGKRTRQQVPTETTELP